MTAALAKTDHGAGGVALLRRSENLDIIEDVVNSTLLFNYIFT